MIVDGVVHSIKPQQLNFYILKNYTIKETQCRDITILIFLLWFDVEHYYSLFQYFINCP